MEKLLISDEKYNYSNVKRWTKKFDIFTKHKIVCPINLRNTHWVIAVIYMADEKIHYYDSMSGSGDKYLQALKQWVVDEALDKKKLAIDVSNWKLISNEKHVPQQTNGYDCGVFTTICADFISDDLPLEYDQNDMEFFREKIGTDIVRGCLNYPLKCLRTDS
jgi:sentrin-specific protease 1